MDLGPSVDEDLFDWRDDYPPGSGDEPQDREALLNKRFSDYVGNAAADYAQRYRAPWMTREY